MTARPQDVALLPLPEPSKPPFYFCNKCGHMGDVGPSHPDANGTGEMCDYHATGGEKWYGADEVNAIARANVTAALASAQAREDVLRAEGVRIERENREGWKQAAHWRGRAERLEEALRKIATVAHAGGSVGMSEADALTAIRKLTLKHWDRNAEPKHVRATLSTNAATQTGEG